MEHTWKICGVHADWEMTVTVSPPEDPEESTAGGCQDAKFDALAAHFRNLVEMYEAWGELGQPVG